MQSSSIVQPGCDFFRNFGAGDVTRTRDLLITNQLLYQLSYAGQAGMTILARR